MHERTAEAIINILSNPVERTRKVILRGYNQYGQEFTEEIMIPENGDTVTTTNKFFSQPQKYKS